MAFCDSKAEIRCVAFYGYKTERKRVIEMKKNRLLLGGLLCMVLLVSACVNVAAECPDAADAMSATELVPLPPPERDGGPFGVDVNINMSTIDDWLERPDVAYFDMRMLYDPAQYENIGGVSRLTRTLPGFRVISFPYIATMSPLPVDGAYDGITLFSVVWGEELGEILELKPNFVESERIINDIFPKDKAIFLMCGGAGYTHLTRSLLIHMGWDENLIYHTGGNWHYEGDRSIEMTIPGADPESDIATWRVNYAFIDFDRLTPIG